MHLTEHEKVERLALMKTELCSLQKFDEKKHHDAILNRFLRARRYDVSKSVKMFVDYVNWREEAHVDEIVKTFVFPEAAQINALYTRFYHKVDKKGRPIYIEQLANVDCKKIFTITTPERLLNAFIREYEKVIGYRLPACSLKLNSPVETGCTIIDLKGVPLTQFNQVRKLLQQVTAIASNYYPETMGRMFIINTPMLFKGVWSLIKPMLDEVTVSKIVVLGSNYEKELLEEIDAENLPAFYGGKCSCTGGCENSDLGPWNDGSVPGYPMPFWEDYKQRDLKG